MMSFPYIRGFHQRNSRFEDGPIPSLDVWATPRFFKNIFGGGGGGEGGTLYIGYWWSAFSVSSCAGCHSARRQVGRGSGPAAAGRCPTVSGHWDCRWCHDCPYQAQHHHPHQADPDLHHLLRQPAWSIDPGGYKLVMHGVFSVLNLNLLCNPGCDTNSCGLNALWNG